MRHSTGNFRTVAMLAAGVLTLLLLDAATAQTPELGLVLGKADLYDEEGNVVAQANEGDVLTVMMGGDQGLISEGGPPKARLIDAKHFAYPGQPAGKELLEKLIAANSKNPQHYHLRADNRWYAKDYDGMIADLTKAIELAPDDPNGHQRRANAWIHIKEYDKALADLKEAIRIDPEMRYTTLYTVARIYGDQQDWQRQIEVYSELIELEKQNNFSKAQYLVGRGQAYETLQRWDEAKADYTAAQELHPRDRQSAAGLERLRNRE